MLGVVGFGLAYLVQSSIRRRSWTLPAPPSKSPVKQAQSDARFMRVGAVAELVIAFAAVVAAVGRGHWHWLPGHGWTAFLLLNAALGIAGAPHLWAIAERRATQRTLRWAWALSGAFDAVFGVAAAAIAITNQRSHWIGGWLWTVVLAALALLWLLGAPSDLARARRTH